MDCWVRLLFLIGTASIFFMVGYLYGEMRATGPSSIELHSMIVQFHELQRPAPADIFLKASDLDQLEQEVAGAQTWAAASSLTAEALRQRQAGVRALARLGEKTLEAARLGLASPRYERAQVLLTALGDATTASRARLEALLPAAAGAEANLTASSGATVDGELVVQVAERPFGAHIRRGSTRVAEVFPGFPAHRSGVRPGCEMTSIAGKAVSAGTWMETFQRARLPFEIRLRCQSAQDKTAGQGPLDSDPHRFRVMVVKKPFGMNIQVHVAPRVVEVLPGFPAEAAGVREGFVLTELNDQRVDAVTWFDAFQSTPLPFTLTFDTTIPVHAGNPFVGKNDSKHFVYLKEPPLSDAKYMDFQCEVPAVPFGMQIRAPLRGRPRVVHVQPGSLADKQGVHAEDVLVEVAGRAVNSSTWFAVFQQAAPPFGLKFRRPYRMRL